MIDTVVYPEGWVARLLCALFGHRWVQRSSGCTLVYRYCTRCGEGSWGPS